MSIDPEAEAADRAIRLERLGHVLSEEGASPEVDSRSSDRPTQNSTKRTKGLLEPLSSTDMGNFE